MRQSNFPWIKALLLGLGNLGLSCIWPIFNQFVPLFLQAGHPGFENRLLANGSASPVMIGFALSPALAMFVMTWDNLINIFVQPWVGARSDRTRNRFGRRKGWVLLGAPLALLGFVFIPVAQSLLAVMVFILITNVGMAFFRSPANAWLGDLFSIHERSQANGIINLLGGVGGLLAYFGGGMLFNAFGRLAPFLAGALVTLLAVIGILFFLKEPDQLQEADQEKVGVFENFRQVWTAPDRSERRLLLSILLWFVGFSALETGLSSFAVFNLGLNPGNASILIGSIAASFIVFAVPAGWLGSRLGSQKVIRLGLAGLVSLFLLGYFVIHGAVGLVIILALAGFCWAMVNVNSLPLVLELGDARRFGAFTGLYYLSSQLAAVLGPTLGGVLVSAMGLDYRWLWLFSSLFMACSWLVMAGVHQKKD